MECSGNTLAHKAVLSKNDDGKEITVKVGDIIRIELMQYSGTGYIWVLEEAYKGFFELIREEKEVTSRPGLVSGPVTKIWELKAIKSGQTEINLYLCRPWEGKDRAVDAFKVRIKIF